MLLSRPCLAVVIGAAVAACGDDGAAPDATPCRVGDVSADPTVELIYRTADGTMAPLADGAVLPLMSPPQGGKIVLVSMRVRDAELCGATIQAALRDPCTNRILGIERRPVAWRFADDGFAEPAQPQELSDFVNLPLCPNAGAADDLDGHIYQLEMRFYETPDAQPIERLLDVTLSCDDELDPDGCKCECDADYELGGACPSDPDGGVDCVPS